MRKKILMFVLTVSLMLTMTPETLMAAKMEGKSMPVREAEQKTPSEEKEAAAGGVSDMKGDGTKEAPYRIGNAEQFRAFADLVNGADGVPETGICASLTDNISLSGICGAEIGSWTPIGTVEHPYTGTFDGGSFTITGLYCHEPDASYTGLFGYNAGTIKNIGVVGADIRAGNYTGGVCGYNSGIISGCRHAATTRGVNYTGGICGYNAEGGIVNVCYNTGTVSGRKYVGGVCGYNKNNVVDCYNQGPVNGESTSIGGVCGYNKALLSNCFNTGTVNGGGRKYVGSVCGYNYSKSTFLNCYYLITGEEKGNYGVAMSEAQFASGEVCWLLNGEKSENAVWHQTCGVGFPTFAGKKVYRVQRQKEGGRADEIIVSYTNEKEQKQAADVSAQANASDQDSGDAEHRHNYRDPEWKWTEYESAKAVFTCQDCGEKVTLAAKISERITPATCAAEGKTVYTASVNKDGKNYTNQKIIKSEKLPHQTPLTQVMQRDESCEENGIKACWTCDACGKYFADAQGATELSKSQVVIPALGHLYTDPKWEWHLDHNPVTASATFHCDRGCGETEIIEAKVTSKTSATCTTAGETTYTAVAKIDDRSYTDERKISGQPIPHSYGEPKWTWAADKRLATATFTCGRCNHTETVSDTNPISEKAEEPTCLKAGKVAYTARVTFEGEEYTDVKTETIPKTEHSYSGQPKWTWEDYSKATAAFICDICKRSIQKDASIEEKKTLGSDCKTPGTITYTASVVFNGTTYTDQKKEDIAPEHNLTYIAAKEATCTSEGNKEYWQCSACGHLFGDAEGTEEITTIPTIPELEHDFEKVMKDVYRCRLCKKSFTITEQPDGTKSISSVEDDEVILQETPLQFGLEEEQEDKVPLPAEEQDADVTQTIDGQTGEDEQDKQRGQEEQAGEDIRNESDENRDGIMEAPEGTARYGLVYPENETEEADAWEENAVNLRAKSQGNAAAQTVQERQASSLWGAMALLLALGGFILILLYKGKKVMLTKKS